MLLWVFWKWRGDHLGMMLFNQWLILGTHLGLAADLENRESGREYVIRLGVPR